VRTLWIDDHHDTARYDAHLRDNLGEFAGVFGDIAPVAFACTAWRLSVPPARSPGLVHWHRRVLSAACVRSDWDGSLTAQVSLVSPWPAALSWPRDWDRDRGWRDWPTVLGQYVHPLARDLASTPYLRASLLIEAPLSFADLPPTPEGPEDAVAETARRAVTVLARELNELVSPIVRKLENGSTGQPLADHEGAAGGE
jgi:hypothetical protein